MWSTRTSFNHKLHLLWLYCLGRKVQVCLQADNQPSFTCAWVSSIYSRVAIIMLTLVQLAAAIWVQLKFEVQWEFGEIRYRNVTLQHLRSKEMPWLHFPYMCPVSRMHIQNVDRLSHDYWIWLWKPLEEKLFCDPCYCMSLKTLL